MSVRNKTEEQKPNLRWSNLAKSEPPESYRDGLELVEMPSADEVKKGFYSEDAQRLKSLSGGLLVDYDFKEQFDSDLPEDFPMREVLRGHNLPFEQVSAMTLEQLVSLEGIGAKSAQKILDYKPAESGEENASEVKN